MDITYERLKKIYIKHFDIGNYKGDFTNKLALISLICFLTYQMQLKKPDITHYQVIKKLCNVSIEESFIKGLAIVCESMSYACKEFPTFDIKPKDVPAKIKELLDMRLPF